MKQDPTGHGFDKRHIFEFDVFGYTILRDFLPADLVGTMNAILDSRLEGHAVKKFPFLNLDPVFWDLMSHPRVMNICRYLLGAGFRLDSTFGIQFEAAASETPAGREDLHAGPFASQGAFRYAWYDNKPQCGQIVCVYYLEDVEEGDGGLVLVPGSHKMNVAISGPSIHKDILKAKMEAWWLHNPAMKAGDLLIFTEAVVHGTQTWKNTRHRRRNLQYCYGPPCQAQRDYEQIRKFLPLARNDTERDLLRPPYALRYGDAKVAQGENEWRSPVR